MTRAYLYERACLQYQAARERGWNDVALLFLELACLWKLCE